MVLIDIIFVLNLLIPKNSGMLTVKSFFKLKSWKNNNNLD